MSHKVRAIEFRTRDGHARGWWTDRARDGYPMAAWAVRVPGCRSALGHPAPWVTCVKVSGRYGWHGIGAYGSLVQARMWVLGGNGHVHRGHSSIIEVRQMSRPNILALAAAPHRYDVTPESIPAPWRS